MSLARRRGAVVHLQLAVPGQEAMADVPLPPGADMIDKATKEIKQDDDKTVYKSLEEIGEDLPDHSPRFVLLSYPMTLVRSPFS